MMNIFQQDNTGRIRTLQASRFLFVFLIYLSHSIEPLAGSSFDFGGESGVAFFFVLSGFVLSYGYGPRVSRGEFRSKWFFWQHFCHLYPLHLLFFVLTLVLDYKLGIRYDSVQIVANLLLVQTWIPSNHTLFVVNGVSWFLCDVLFCYVVFAPLYRLLTSIAPRRLFMLFAVFAVVYARVAQMVPSDMVNCTLYVNPLLRCVDFSLGILAYRCYKQKQGCGQPPCVGNAKVYTIISKGFPLVDIAVLLVVYVVYQYANQGIRSAMLFWSVMPLLVLRLAAADRSDTLGARMLRSPLLMRLGGISFEIFMAHLFVNRIVQHFVVLDGTVQRAAINLVLGVAATITVAFMVQKTFVKPLSSVINKRLLR